MTVTKRRGKRTDAGRRYTMACTFVSDVPRILCDTVSSCYNLWENSVQCMRGVVCSAVMKRPCVKYTLQWVLHAHFSRKGEACELAGVT